MWTDARTPQTRRHHTNGTDCGRGRPARDNKNPGAKTTPATDADTPDSSPTPAARMEAPMPRPTTPAAIALGLPRGDHRQSGRNDHHQAARKRKAVKALDETTDHRSTTSDPTVAVNCS